MMTSILLLGILIGMRHAFEADHVGCGRRANFQG